MAKEGRMFKRLSDDEVTIDAWLLDRMGPGYRFKKQFCKDLTRAAEDEILKQVVEWGNAECLEHPTCETTVLLKRECEECWQALKQQMEE